MGKRRNLYEVLGVPRDAGADALRKRYRKRARELHPDLHPDDPSAEEAFKELSEAFAVLGDPDKRRAYDDFGEVSLESGFDVEAARSARTRYEARRGGAHRDFEAFFGNGEASFGDGADLGDLFGGLFGRAGPRPPARGADLEAQIELDFLDALRGGERQLQLRRPDASPGAAGRSVKVRFPPGVADGDRLRVPGQGAPGSTSGPAGDLWVRVRVRPHPLFTRQGHDLCFELPISAREAILGAEVEVPTPDGRATLRVPAGTDSGTRLRLRGKGVPRTSGPPGDLLARVRIRVPKELDAEGREAVSKLERFEDADLRARLFRGRRDA